MLSGAKRWLQRSVSAATPPSARRNSRIGSPATRRRNSASPISDDQAAMYQTFLRNGAVIALVLENRDGASPAGRARLHLVRKTADGEPEGRQCFEIVELF